MASSTKPPPIEALKPISSVSASPRLLPTALALPPKWLNMYSSFITANQSSVTQIESALRSLTYIIPGRFRDAELASESLHSSIQLLSMYHDTLLTRAISKLPGMPNASLHNRYTKFWIAKSKFYRRIATMLTMIQYTELLWEMMAKRKGERVRWRIIVVLELVKAVCRLCLLWITNSRPLVTPALPEREIIPEEEAPTEEEEIEMEEEVRPRIKEYKMKRTGLSLPTLPNPSDISSYLLSKVLTADDIKAPNTLLNKPVIYAIAMSRSNNKKNWQPWLLGLSIEYAARQLRKDGLRTTALERDQWGKRGWSMGWWAMRGAFYENITKGFLQSTSERLPSLVSGVLDDYKYLWDEYYFSTSSN
ncbi:Peroxisomal membrane protein [Lachnellula subtilissima]|uniref:Peroxisomal membrane protein PEX16 n=1 Tax=Lachnellula subtilissima TaxID=602034 RepID=A0A8H8RW62_9HELO|nr:Peroxisomal membrane protein [Lachnellula subtilissima]